MALISRYSYTLFSVLVLGLIWGLVVRRPENTVGLVVFLTVLAVLVLGWQFLRRAESPPNPYRRLRKVLGAGRPVVVHFYSDYCMRCMSQKPRLDALQKEFKGPVEFLFLNLSDPAVREVAGEYGAGSGTVILFAAGGEEVSRGLPTSGKLAELTGARPRGRSR